VQLPDPNQPMDPQAEYALSGLLAQAAQAVQTQNQNQQAQQTAQQQAQDPLVQMQQQELALKGREVTVKERDQTLKEAIAQHENKVGPPNGPNPAAMQAVGQAHDIQNSNNAAAQQQAIQASQAQQQQVAKAAQAQQQQAIQGAQAAQAMRHKENQHTLSQVIAARKAEHERILRERAAEAAKNKPEPKK
jgi:hypothetical protein